MSATGTFRNIRHSLRKRGIDLDRFLPLAGLAAGALAGLLAWGVLSGWFLDDRAEDAARALVDRVGGQEFQDEWFAAARAKDGLCSHGRLQASLVDPAEEGKVHLVLLVCQGRPCGSARLALDRARDTLADRRSSGISPLLPRNHAQHVAVAERRVADAKKIASQAEAQVQALRDANAKAADRTKQAQAAVDAIQKQLAGTDEKALTAQRRDRVDQRAKLASPADGPVALTEAEQLKLRGDYARLERLLREDSRRDSTADHPIVRRMTEIAHRLKLADLDRNITEIDKKLDKLKPLMAEMERAQAALEAAVREGDQVQKDLGEASDRLARGTGELSTRGVERTKLDSVPKTPVEVAAVSAISDVVERDWLLWACLGGGLAAGLLFMVVLRFRVEARHSQINSSSGLAHCLHVPVLGVVPDLGRLSAEGEHA